MPNTMQAGVTASQKFDRAFARWSRKLRAAVLAVAPDAYWVAGLGWCGPNFQDATQAERDFRHSNPAPVWS